MEGTKHWRKLGNGRICSSTKKLKLGRLLPFLLTFLLPLALSSLDHSTPASQSPHSSNPSSLPSSPPTHNHNSVPFSNFGPIGTPDNRDRRVADRWKAEKPGKCWAADSRCLFCDGFATFL